MFYNINATNSVNEVLKHASAVAKEYNNSEIATEHLLFGVLCVKDSPSCKILNSYKIDKKNYEQVLKENASEKYAFDVDMELTDRAKQVFLVAQKLSSQLGHENVDVEHLLFSILLSEGSVAIEILEEIYHINLNELRQKVLDELRKIAVKPEVQQQKQVAQIPEKLMEFGVDLSLKAEQGKIDPIIGREVEIDRLIEILCRKTKNNPVLIGEAGVGKSAVVEGLAQRIADKKVPEILANKRIYSLNLSALMAGTKYRGSLEQKLNEIISIITNNKNIITFIDEIHTLMQAGSEKGEINPSDILKPYLARGDMQTIGATTIDEYSKFIEKDKALERRFQPIVVNPPSEEDAIKILQGLKSTYEKFHGVTITEDAIESAVKMSVRYITNRNLPDKAIDLLDEASAKAKIDKKDNAVVDSEDIAKVVSTTTNIPVSKITETEKEKLLNLENILHKRVIGQDEAINAVCKAIRRARVGLKDSKRPIGSFIFLGQTGVGKTELAKALAECLFDDEKSLIRIDMSEYMEQHSVSKLIGSPPGFVGYEEGGQLTDKVRKNPYSVVLFDEVEKAHPDILNILLQILDDGRVTDGQGRLVNFHNTIIILTSNVGAKKVMEQRELARIEGKELDIASQTEIMKQELVSLYRPELLNRIDLIVVFKPLSFEELAKIANLMIQSLNKKLLEHNISLKLTESALIYLIQKGYNTNYGARPLRRIIEQEIEDIIAGDMLEGKLKNHSQVLISFSDEKLCFEYNNI